MEFNAWLIGDSEKENNKREVSYSRTKITYAHTWRGFPGGLDDEESPCNAAGLGSAPESGKLPWRREWLPTPELWPGESHGQKSLAGYGPGVTKNWA